MMFAFNKLDLFTETHRAVSYRPRYKMRKLNSGSWCTVTEGRRNLEIKVLFGNYYPGESDGFRREFVGGRWIYVKNNVDPFPQDALNTATRLFQEVWENAGRLPVYLEDIASGNSHCNPIWHDQPYDFA